MEEIAANSVLSFKTLKTLFVLEKFPLDLINLLEWNCSLMALAKIFQFPLDLTCLRDFFFQFLINY